MRDYRSEFGLLVMVDQLKFLVIPHHNSFQQSIHGSTAPAGTTSKFGHPFTFSFAGLPHHCIMKMLVLHTCAHGFHNFSKPV